MKPVKIGVQKSDHRTDYYIMDNSGRNSGILFYMQFHHPSKNEILGITEAEHRREVCERVMYCTLAAVGFEPIFVVLE